MFNRNNRIFEETASTPHLFWSWQFSPTNLGDDIGQLLRSGVLYACRLKRIGECLILKVWRKDFVQTEYHRPNDIVIAECSFKDAVTIGKLTLRIGENTFLTGEYIKSTDTIDDIFCLYPIGSHILNRSSPNSTRNGDKIFSTIPTVGDTVMHKIIPHLTSRCLDKDIIL